MAEQSLWTMEPSFDVLFPFLVAFLTLAAVRWLLRAPPAAQPSAEEMRTARLQALGTSRPELTEQRLKTPGVASVQQPPAEKPLPPTFKPPPQAANDPPQTAAAPAAKPAAKPAPPPPTPPPQAAEKPTAVAPASKPARPPLPPLEPPPQALRAALAAVFRCQAVDAIDVDDLLRAPMSAAAAALMRDLSAELVREGWRASQAARRDFDALHGAWLKARRVRRTFEEEAARDGSADAGARREAASVLEVASQQLVLQAVERMSVGDDEDLFSDSRSSGGTALLVELGRGAISADFVSAMLASPGASPGDRTSLLRCMLLQLGGGDGTANEALASPQHVARMRHAMAGVRELTATASALPAALAALLRAELATPPASSSRGHLSLDSALAPLLAPTPLPVSRANEKLLGGGDKVMLDTVRDALELHTDLVASLMQRALKGEGREAVLDHLAALTALPRAPPPSGGPPISPALGGAVNACRLLLRLCRPFLGANELSSALSKVSVSYVAEEGAARVPFTKALPLISSAAGAAGAAPHRFVTEVFFLTLHSLHTALRPLRRTFEGAMSRLAVYNGKGSKEEHAQALLRSHRQFGVVLLHEQLLPVCTVCCWRFLRVSSAAAPRRVCQPTLSRMQSILWPSSQGGRAARCSQTSRCTPSWTAWWRC